MNKAVQTDLHSDVSNAPETSGTSHDQPHAPTKRRANDDATWVLILVSLIAISIIGAIYYIVKSMHLPFFKDFGVLMGYLIAPR